MLKLLPSCRLSLLLALLQTTSVWGAITAPESAKPGELVRVASDVEADWIVQPEEYSANVYVDSNKKTLVFASGQPGTVYIFAATSDDGGAPKAQCWRLVITPDAPDNPAPVPNAYPQTVTDAIAKIQSKTIDAEKQTFIKVLKSTAGFIDAGSINTPAGVRETIRRNWLLQTASVNPDAPTVWQDATDALMEALNAPELATAKQNVNALIEAMEGRNER